ncbi:MAG: hypothetical protein ABF743_00500 [Schleiferilactobacillus perolens]|uniref:hypothetical protein n=1 Tax=Schleiferilactobacillus perolens TaxID=100468 RepID=UPI0039E76CF5
MDAVVRFFTSKWLIGVVFIALGVLQLFLARRYFRSIKKYGNKNTSPFSLLGVYFSYFIGVVFILAALNAMLSK